MARHWIFGAPCGTDRQVASAADQRCVAVLLHQQMQAGFSCEDYLATCFLLTQAGLDIDQVMQFAAGHPLGDAMLTSSFMLAFTDGDALARRGLDAELAQKLSIFDPLVRARMAPDSALKLAADHEGNVPETAVADIIVALAAIAPERAAEWAPARLALIHNPLLHASTMLILGIDVAKCAPGLAAELYRQGKEQLSKSATSFDAVRLARLAVLLAIRLHNGEEQKLVKLVLDMAQQRGKGQVQDFAAQCYLLNMAKFTVIVAMRMDNTTAPLFIGRAITLAHQAISDVSATGQRNPITYRNWRYAVETLVKDTLLVDLMKRCLTPAVISQLVAMAKDAGATHESLAGMLDTLSPGNSSLVRELVGYADDSPDMLGMLCHLANGEAIAAARLAANYPPGMRVKTYLEGLRVAAGTDSAEAPQLLAQLKTEHAVWQSSDQLV